MKNGKHLILCLILALLFSSIIALAQQSGNVNAIGKATAAEHKLVVARITVDELKSAMEKNRPMTIVDVRSQAAYDGSSTKISGSIRVTPADYRTRLENVQKDREIITYCSCPTDGGAIALAEQLMADGYTRVKVLTGGWNGWLQANGRVEAK